jgi:two-component system, cell cycle response regulator
MDSHILISADLEPPVPAIPGGKVECIAIRPADFRIPTTRGIGKFIENISPQLLKNTFHNILFVDDDPALHIFIDRVLVNSGYVVEHAMTGIEALSLIRNHLPDFLLLDWEMPNMTGVSVCETLRSTLLEKYLYIIMMTGRNRVRDKVQAIAAGADDFLVKPILAGEMLTRLQTGTRIMEQELRLKELSTHDLLTGLLNRRIFFEMLEKEWNRSQREAAPLSCAMIDIDLFKRINDGCGQLHGDKTLVRIGELLRRSCPESDLICRYGDDEFCALLIGADLHAALARMEKFRRAVEEERQLAAEHAAFPTVTVGVAEYAGDMQSPNTVLEKAEEALLYGKIIRRNVVAAYNASTASHAVFSEECGLKIE